MADPFVAMNSIQAANRNESLPLFVEYGYDFDKQCFRYDEKGQNLMVTENEALKVWIYKAILTERYRYLAYDDSYGITIINHIEVEKRERDDLAITVDVTSIYSDESLIVTAGRSEA